MTTSVRAGEKCSEAFASLLCISVTTAHVMSVFYERENYARREREREREQKGWRTCKCWMCKMKYYYVQRMCIVCTHYSLRVVQHDVLGCRCTPAQFELYSVRIFFSSPALRCVCYATTPSVDCESNSCQFFSSFSRAYMNHIFSLTQLWFAVCIFRRSRNNHVKCETIFHDSIVHVHKVQ